MPSRHFIRRVLRAVAIRLGLVAPSSIALSFHLNRSFKEYGSLAEAIAAVEDSNAWQAMWPAFLENARRNYETVTTQPTAPQRVLLAALQNLAGEGERFLFAGCGHAPSRQYLTANGLKLDYTGVDISPELIDMAREHYGRADDFQVCSIDTLPFADRSFNGVVLEGVIQCTYDPAAALKECARVAERFLIVHWTPIFHSRPTGHFVRQSGGAQFVETVFNEQDLVKEIINAGFLLRDVVCIERKKACLPPAAVHYHKTYIAERSHTR